MTNISAIIAVKGNPSYLLESLKSIHGFATEIILIDIGIEAQLKDQLPGEVTVMPLHKEVPYIELIREELKQYATHEWILFLDPDESLPVTLIQKLQDAMLHHDYISLPRKNIIFNKWIQHSRWWPDYQIRLFKKNAAFWPKTIHAQPETHGKGLTLPAEEDLAIIHYNYASVDEYVTKLLRYTKAEAQEFVAAGKQFTITESLHKSLSEFIGRYFAAEGYKDGMHGFVLALLQMFYYVLVYVFYWQAKGYPDTKPEKNAGDIQQFFAKALYETNHWILTKKIRVHSGAIKHKLANIILKILE